jgi:hypothetical protein
MHFRKAISRVKVNRRVSHDGLAPVQLPVNVLTPSTGRTERFTLRPVAISLQAALSFRNLNAQQVQSIKAEMPRIQSGYGAAFQIYIITGSIHIKDRANTKRTAYLPSML